MGVDEIDLLRNDVLSNRFHRPQDLVCHGSKGPRRQTLAMRPDHHFVVGRLRVQECANFGGAAQLFQRGTKIDDDGLFAVVPPLLSRCRIFMKKSFWRC